jgi:transcriptional regulator with XRE-family HTH domain
MGSGSMIRGARLRAGMTLRELAARAGTSDATVSAYENGAKDPRAMTLIRVLAAAGTELQPVPLRTGNQRFVDLLCHEIAARIAQEPELIERAREELPRLAGRSSWADVWTALLDAGPVAVIAVLTSTSPEATALKTDSPFALLGLVSESDRLQLLEIAHAA